jgi:hypothetical protein
MRFVNGASEFERFSRASKFEVTSGGCLPVAVATTSPGHPRCSLDSTRSLNRLAPSPNFKAGRQERLSLGIGFDGTQSRRPFLFISLFVG